MKLLDQYFDVQQAIFDYFGYKEDWVAIPLDGATEYYWVLFQNENGSGEVVFYEKPITQEIIVSGKIYSDSIYTQRFLKQWVYEGKDYTMVCCDTHTDGNKFLRIFDNKKRIDEKNLEYEKMWIKPFV